MDVFDPVIPVEPFDPVDTMEEQEEDLRPTMEYLLAAVEHQKLQDSVQRRRDVPTILAHLAEAVEALARAAERQPDLVKRDPAFRAWWEGVLRVARQVETEAAYNPATRALYEGHGDRIMRFLGALPE